MQCVSMLCRCIASLQAFPLLLRSICNSTEKSEDVLRLLLTLRCYVFARLNSGIFRGPIILDGKRRSLLCRQTVRSFSIRCSQFIERMHEHCSIGTDVAKSWMSIGTPPPYPILGTSASMLRSIRSSVAKKTTTCNPKGTESPRVCQFHWKHGLRGCDVIFEAFRAWQTFGINRKYVYGHLKGTATPISAMHQRDAVDSIRGLRNNEC